jgi:hypothetical protein
MSSLLINRQDNLDEKAFEEFQKQVRLLRELRQMIVLRYQRKKLMLRRFQPSV